MSNEPTFHVQLSQRQYLGKKGRELLERRVSQHLGPTALPLTQQASKEALPPLGEVAVPQVVEGTDGLQNSTVGHAHEPHGAKENTVTDELLEAFFSLQVLRGKTRQSGGAKISALSYGGWGMGRCCDN